MRLLWCKKRFGVDSFVRRVEVICSIGVLRLIGRVLAVGGRLGVVAGYGRRGQLD
jgi:hypothetical protein